MPALICAAVALGTLKGIDIVEDSDLADLRDKTYAATGIYFLFFSHRKIPVKFKALLDNLQVW